MELVNAVGGVLLVALGLVGALGYLATLSVWALDKVTTWLGVYRMFCLFIFEWGLAEARRRKERRDAPDA